MVMKIASLWVLFVYMLLETGSSLAMRVNSLYNATLPVADQSAVTRTQAISAALQQVLIKVSGNDSIINQPSLATRLTHTDNVNLVQEFSYTPNPLHDPTHNNNLPYLLTLQLDPQPINQWLREAGAPVWGKNRPLTAVWMTFQTLQHSPEIVSQDSPNGIPTLLSQLAEQRGIPLIFPLMDLNDLNHISAENIAAFSNDIILNASKRYNNHALLIGNIIQTANNQFTSQWKLLLNDTTHTQWDWSLPGNSINAILPILVNNIANTLASHFAIVTTNTIQKELLLTVTGITRYTDYARLTHYLSHLTPVAEVDIKQITENNEVILKISLRSTQTAFAQALSISKKLTPSSSSNDMMTYQWNP
jgi:hypothetical protein